MPRLLIFIHLLLITIYPSFAQEIVQENEASTWNIFFGRFHPLVVHLPIGFIIALLAIEVLRISKKVVIPHLLTYFIISVTILNTLLSILLGYLLSTSGEYESATLDYHLYSAYLFLASMLIVFLGYWYFAKNSTKIAKYGYLLSISLACVLVFFTGHYGGALTHGASYLTDYAPWNKKVERKITDVKTALVFEDLILPILEKKCISCHNQNKVKGGLRMDDYQLLLKGGESGIVIKAGNPEESELYKLATLSPTEKRAMPPDGKTPLSKEELKMIYWWIKNGAENQKQFADLKPDAEIVQVFESYYLPSASSSSLDKIKVPEIKEDVLTELRNAGLLAIRLGSQDNKLQVSFKNPILANDEHWELISKIAKNIVYLDLAETKLSEKSFEKLNQLENLQKLYLQKTAISDKTLKIISGLKNLEILNLYDTKISDEGLSYLKDCATLKKVFLWKTKTSLEARNELKNKLPELNVYEGVDSTAVSDSTNM